MIWGCNFFKYKSAVEKYRFLKTETRNSIAKNKLNSVLTICLTNHSTIQNVSDYKFVQGALKTKNTCIEHVCICLYIKHKINEKANFL